MTNNTAKYKIANIPGDGIGKEVVPEGLRVLDAVGRKYGIEFSFADFDWSCETYTKTGRMMPEDGTDQLRDTMRYFSAPSAFRAYRIMCRSGDC